MLVGQLFSVRVLLALGKAKESIFLIINPPRILQYFFSYGLSRIHGLRNFGMRRRRSFLEKERRCQRKLDNIIVFSAPPVIKLYLAVIMSRNIGGGARTAVIVQQRKMSFLRSAHSVAKSLTATESVCQTVSRRVAISEQRHPISFIDINDAAAIEFSVFQWN